MEVQTLSNGMQEDFLEFVNDSNALDAFDALPLTKFWSKMSKLYPYTFTVYTTPMQCTFRRHGVRYHTYAYDIQLYASYNPAVLGDQVETVRRLTDCIREVRRWVTLHMQKLNDDKTGMIISSYMEFAP